MDQMQSSLTLTSSFEYTTDAEFGYLASCSGSITLSGSAAVETTDYFVFSVKTDNSGLSTDYQYQLKVQALSGYTFDFDVDWGDGNTDTGVSATITHTYSTIGTYDISISGTFPRFYNYNTTGDEDKIVDVKKWGKNKWKSIQNMFHGCSNISTFSATDIPDLSECTYASGAFSRSTFNGDIGDWDVSNITNMSRMFEYSSFNSDISGWNTQNVTNMSDMFYVNGVFNQDIGSWNTQNVTNMDHMFYNAEDFDQDIGSWNTQNVTDMESMFHAAHDFNQDIGSWNTRKVSQMGYMFYQAYSFNQDISDWCVSLISSEPSFFENGGWLTTETKPDWGSCSTFQNFERVVSGTITTSGSATTSTESAGNEYTGSGTITTSGSATTSTESAGEYEYSGSGTITTSGVATTSYTPDYSYTPSGSISISGVSNTSYMPDFIYTGSGIITLSGDATEIEVNDYTYTMTGSISISGIALTSYTYDYSYTPTGSIVVSGNATNSMLPNFPYSPSGTINVSGSVPTQFSYSEAASLDLGSEYTAYNNYALNNYIDYLGSDKFIFTYYYNNYTYIRIATVNPSTKAVTFGSQKTNTTSSYYRPKAVVALSDTKAILFYDYLYSSGKSYYKVATISGTSITLGPQQTLDGSLQHYERSFAKIDSTHLLYTNNSGTKVLTFNGSSLSSGSFYTFTSGSIQASTTKMLDSSTFVVAYGISSTGTYAAIGSISGTTISFGSEYEISSVSSTYNYIKSIDVINDSKFVISSTTTSNKYYNVCNVSGSTITVENTTTHSGGSYLTSISLSGANNFYSFYGGNSVSGARYCSIDSNDDITLGDEFDFNGGDNIGGGNISDENISSFIIDSEYLLLHFLDYGTSKGVKFLVGDVVTGDSVLSITYPGSGTIYLSGEADVSRYDYIGQGTITLSNSALTSYTYDYLYTGQGTITISGDATEIEVNDYTYTPTGTITLSGSASIDLSFAYTGSGTITISGDATEQEYNDYVYTGSGSIIISGHASSIKNDDYNYTMSGSITTSGTSLYEAYALYAYQPTGIITISGNATYIEYNDYTYTPTGTITLSGSSSIDFILSYQPTGTITISGNASTEEYNDYVYQSTGSISISGNALTEEFDYYVYSSSGSAYISGGASHSMIPDYTFYPTGIRIYTSGIASYVAYVTYADYIPSGTIVVSGHASISAINDYEYLPSGSINISGTATYEGHSEIGSGLITLGGSVPYQVNIDGFAIDNIDTADFRTGSSVTIKDVIKLSSTKFVVAYLDNVGTPYDSNSAWAVVGEISGGEISYGTPVVILGDETTEIRLSSNSTSRFACVMVDVSGNMYARTCSVSGTTITRNAFANNDGSIFLDSYVSNVDISFTVKSTLNDSYVAISYVKGGDTYVCIFTGASGLTLDDIYLAKADMDGPTSIQCIDEDNDDDFALFYGNSTTTYVGRYNYNAGSSFTEQMQSSFSSSIVNLNTEKISDTKVLMSYNNGTVRYITFSTSYPYVVIGDAKWLITFTTGNVTLLDEDFYVFSGYKNGDVKIQSYSIDESLYSSLEILDTYESTNGVWTVALDSTHAVVACSTSSTTGGCYYVSIDTQYLYDINDFIYPTSGLITTSGEADYSRYYYTGQGTITLSGTALYEEFNNYEYSGNGNISISGNATYEEFYYYVYQPTGSAYISGGASYSEYNNYTFYPTGIRIYTTGLATTSYQPNYIYTMVDGIYITGNADYIEYSNDYLYQPTGTIVISGHALTGDVPDYIYTMTDGIYTSGNATTYIDTAYFVYQPEGSIVVNGNALTEEYNQYVYESTGSITSSGNALTEETNDYYYSTTGTILTSGSALTEEFNNYTYESSGSIVTSGGASYVENNNYTFYPTGIRIYLSGTADLQIDRLFDMTGSITLSGQPEYYLGYGWEATGTITISGSGDSIYVPQSQETIFVNSFITQDFIVESKLNKINKESLTTILIIVESRL